jgi:hypothetical protein
MKLLFLNGEKGVSRCYLIPENDTQKDRDFNVIF